MIIAAGLSSRMGAPKVGLCFPDGQPFVTKIADALQKAECQNIYLCLPKYAQPQAFEALLSTFGVTTFFNAAPEQQQIGSILSGLKRCPDDMQGLVVWPIDSPMATPELLMQLIQTWESNPEQGIIAPGYRGKMGHPFILGKSLFERLPQVALNGGIRALSTQYPNTFKCVEQSDPQVLLNLNSPSDYREAFNEPPSFLPNAPYFMT
jgi:CTP:molybdopterin cytidylyltransferase MocA